MQTTSPEEKLSYWKQKLQEYRSSGISRRVFSEQHGVKRSTLDYWFARIGKEAKAAEGGLVEVKPPALPIRGPAIQIVVSGHYRIEVQSGFDPLLLAEVVRALESLS